MADLWAQIKRNAAQLQKRAKEAPRELRMLLEPDTALSKQVSDIMSGKAGKSSVSDKQGEAVLKEASTGLAMDLNPISGILGTIRKAVPKLDDIDRLRPFDDKHIENAIKDSSVLAKILKVNEKIKKSPTIETVDALIKQATELPDTNSARTSYAIKDLISTYLLPARRRIEYNSLSPDDIIKNMQDRGIFDETGKLADNVVQVIRGQKSPYERLRTPLENWSKTDLTELDIANHAVFASKSGEEAASYAGAGLGQVHKWKGRLPVSYPMYAKVDESVFNSRNSEHVDKVINELQSVPKLEPDQVKELSQQLRNLHTAGSQDWQKLEVPPIQVAMKNAGFRGFLTDEAGSSSNVGMFDPSSFLSVFSHGKPGVSDIQSFLATAGLLGLVSSRSDETSETSSTNKDDM